MGVPSQLVPWLLGEQSASAPCASMSANVTPSTPGAPSFCLAISDAARSVSILQTWTYRPQKRQDGSAFALTYILRLRSCKSMDAFVISSLPSLCWRLRKWQGPFASQTLLRFNATTGPAATLSSSADFSVSPKLYGLPCSKRFLAGTRKEEFLQLLSMSSSPCCRFHPAEVSSRIGQISAVHVACGPPNPTVAGSALRGLSFSRLQRVHFIYGPVIVASLGDLVDRLQSFSLHRAPLLSKLRGSDFYPGRFASC